MHSGNFEKLYSIIQERILVLDGAMGTMIQAQLPRGDTLCNDLLCITKPELIASIHKAYLEAGADIITSCSFNANAVSFGDYGFADRVYEISRAAGSLARDAADEFSTPEKPRFAAGSMGPTSKSASIAQDINDPGRRSIGWDELEAAYYDNARGLLDGGVHLLLVETVFDTLNAKAAIAAIFRLREERNLRIPVIISASVSGNGRLLSGQTIEAFAVSVSHVEPFSLGLNCSVGTEKIHPWLEALSAFAPFPVCCYPNAGLPDSSGVYGEGPKETAAFMKSFFEQGFLNIAGSCCGSTPAHIAAIAELAKNYPPRQIPRQKQSYLSSLELFPLPVTVSRDLICGGRTDTAGNKEFLGLIQNNEWEDAAALTAGTIEDAAGGIVEVCIDGAFLDGKEAKEAMVRFLNTALFDPEIARLPVMSGSSAWDILEAALKCLQGKSLVNFISLKEGEGEFLRRAALIRRYGAVPVVMLFDQHFAQHSADADLTQSYERSIEIADRSYRLLTGAGYPPEDIVLNPIGPDSFRVCSWIRENCPGVHIAEFTYSPINNCGSSLGLAGGITGIP
ncbi:MAG: homocysteine S-methyltransferase family protein [Treponema sp.]|nr:homocysteine S-methyltransferase family protein [Treponema sp.]